MPSFQPYDDVPGIEGEDGVIGLFATAPQYVGTGPHWASIDPALETMRLQEDYSFPHLWNMQQHLFDLEKSANGFGHLNPLHIPEEAFSRLGLHSGWTPEADMYRQMRYVSPNGAYEGGFSATASTLSEESLSPDSRHQHIGLSRMPSALHNVYSSPSIEVSYTHGNGSWMASTLYSNDPPSSPYASSDHPACNLKDLQYTPDTALEEDRPQPNENHKASIRLPDPEELALSHETAAFADEGLGQSIMDETSTRDEEEDIEELEPDSEADPEYSPRRNPRKSSTTHTRPGMRAPRRTRSNQSSSNAVLGIESRVSKPAHHRRANSNSSKSNSKKIKSFPCTFSHYGCRATFASKNEWKRHVASQHVQLGFYRCDVGFCNPDNNAAARGRSHNDFNRKDLFTQHHRRMHFRVGGGPPDVKYEHAPQALRDDFEAGMEAVRQRCWVVKRAKPARSGCVVCRRVFEEDSIGRTEGSAWDERMEHVGKHFERGFSEGIADMAEDDDLTEWAIREELVVDLGSRGRWLAGLEPVGGEGENGNGGARRARRQRGRGAGDEDEDDDNEE